VQIHSATLEGKVLASVDVLRELDAFALGAALSQPWADIALSGAVTIAQRESNVRRTPLNTDRVA
jgi:aryl-alcohol dehydrogenase-like predicted oxidoreductase